MKKLSIILFLLVSLSGFGQTVTTRQGDSFSALLVMDSTYTLANLKDISVYIGSTEVARKSLGTITTTNVARAFKMSLTSATMRRFQGNNTLQIAVYDSLLGVKRTPGITLVVTASSNSFNNSATNAGVDATININVTSLGITSNAVLATVMKGDPGASVDTTDFVHKVSGYQLSQNNYTSAEKSKLSGIATGATVNSTDAQLRDRSTHTGTQTATTISDFTTASQTVGDVRYGKLGSAQTWTGVNAFNAANTMFNTTTNAGYTVDINGTIRASGAIRQDASTAQILQYGATSSFKIESGTGYTTLGTTSNTPVVVVQNNSETFRLTSGGMVVGSTSLASSAIFSVSSTTKGVLLCPMTTAQINAIVSPTKGLTAFNTTLNTLCFFDGTIWQKCTSTSMN